MTGEEEKQGISFLRIVVAAIVGGLLVIAGLWAWIRVGSRVGDPPYTFARDGARVVKETIESQGAAAVECGSIQVLFDKGLRTPDTFFTDSHIYGTADWSWNGTLTPWGRFVGEIRVDGSARPHRRSFVFVFEQESEDSDVEMTVTEITPDR